MPHTEKTQYNNIGEDAEFDFRKLVDFRVLVISLFRWIPIFAGIAIFTFIVAFLTLKFLYRDSMSRWSVQAQIMCNSRSERTSIYYRPLETKSIAEIIASQNTMQRVVTKMNMLNNDLPMVSSLVTVGIDKAKPSIITITVMHNKREMAMNIANAVAEAGVEEYVQFEDGKTKTLMNEARRMKNKFINELESLEDNLKRQRSLETAFDPIQEQNAIQQQITDCQYKIEGSKIRISVLITQEKEINALLEQTPKQIEGWRRIYGDDTQEIEKLLGEYNSLREIFTDTHPRVLNAKAAYEAKKTAPKKTGSDEVTFVANSAYSQLESKRNGVLIDMRMEERLLDATVKQLEHLTAQSLDIAKRVDTFRSTNAKMDALKRQIDNIQSKIEDYDLQLNYSSAQDLEIFPLALSKIRKNELNYYMIAGIFSVFLTMMCVALAALHEIFTGNAKSLKEIANITGWTPLGELPDINQPKITGNFFKSAMISAFNNLNIEFGRKKILFAVELKESLGANIIPGWIEQYGVNGRTVFRLSMKNGAIAENDEKINPHQDVNDSIADELISIEKFANRGTFLHSDRLFLLPAECELLKADINVLLAHYDMIIIEYTLTQGQIPKQLLVQLSQIADYTIFVAAFNYTTKFSLRTLSAIYKEDLPEAHVGSLIADLRTPFIRK